MNWIETLSISGAVMSLALIVAIGLSLIRESKKPISSILLLILMCFTGMSLVANAGVLKEGSFLLNLFSAFLFLIGPLIYQFITFRCYQQNWKRADWIHYVLALLYLVLVVLDLETSVLVGPKILLVLYLISAIQLSAYAFLSFHKFIRYLGQLKEQSSQDSGLIVVKTFLLFILLLSLVCMMHFLPSFGLRDPIHFMSANLSWLLIVALIFALNIFLSTQKSFHRLELLNEVEGTHYLNSDSHDLVQKLHHLMAKDKLYLNPELNLQDIADRLNVSKANLSGLLNRALQTNFYDFVNGLRVKHFEESVRSGRYSNLTYVGIAQQSGFRSKTTFFKTFKSIYGMTPRQYFLATESNEIGRESSLSKA